MTCDLPMLSIGVMQERGNAIDMHGAGAAKRHAAAELRSGHAEHVAQHPEQRRVVIDIDALRVFVDLDGERHDVPSSGDDASRLMGRELGFLSGRSA
jgi:hypothetical protein